MNNKEIERLKTLTPPELMNEVMACPHVFVLMKAGYDREMGLLQVAVEVENNKGENILIPSMVRFRVKGKQEGLPEDYDFSIHNGEMR